MMICKSKNKPTELRYAKCKSMYTMYTVYTETLECCVINDKLIYETKFINSNSLSAFTFHIIYQFS